MKHPRSGTSLSPVRQRFGSRGSVTKKFNASEESTPEQIMSQMEDTSGKSGESIRQARPIPVSVVEKVPDIPNPNGFDCGAPPPRRRMGRRCSATSYNIGNYAAQVQATQGDLNR